MAEYQILANGKDDDLGHSFLPEFKRFERFGLTLPYDITPQGDIVNESWTTFDVPSIYDRVLSICIAAPSRVTGAWIAEKIIDEMVITSAGNVLQRITNNYVRFWYQCLPQDKKSLWDKMTSSTEVGERVFIDIPFAFAQDSSASLIPWGSLKLHVKWSNRVETLVDTGKLILNTRNVIMDNSHYDKTKGMNAYEVMEKYNETKQLIVQTHEQSQDDHENSASTFLDLRGPCKDIWFGLKANADFSAHTSDVDTDDLYVVQPEAAVGGSLITGIVDNSIAVTSDMNVFDASATSTFGPFTLNPSSTTSATGVIGDLDVTLTAYPTGGGTSTTTASITSAVGTINIDASGTGWLPGDIISFSGSDLEAAALPAVIICVGPLELTITASMLVSFTPAISLGCTQPHQSLGVVRLSSIALGQTLTAANMKVNDEQLFVEQRAGFFNKVIPYYRYTGCPAPGYYYYSFALYPQRYTPSGAFNFSRAGDKYLNITNDPYLSTLHVISNRYNVTDHNIPLFLD